MGSGLVANGPAPGFNQVRRFEQAGQRGVIVDARHGLFDLRDHRRCDVNKIIRHSGECVIGQRRTDRLRSTEPARLIPGGKGVTGQGASAAVMLEGVHAAPGALPDRLFKRMHLGDGAYPLVNVAEPGLDDDQAHALEDGGEFEFIQGGQGVGDGAFIGKRAGDVRTSGPQGHAGRALHPAVRAAGREHGVLAHPVTPLSVSVSTSTNSPEALRVYQTSGSMPFSPTLLARMWIRRPSYPLR